MKKKNLAFTLAEVLIVIGIIGVVAALTLPNLNHATGDKETVTRLQKAISVINEANDRAVAVYGPMSTWNAQGQCPYLDYCWIRRIGEFLKISNYCDENGLLGSSISCDSLKKGDDMNGSIIYQLPDNISIGNPSGNCDECNCNWVQDIYDICLDEITIDINGPLKGENKGGYDIFRVSVSNTLGVMPTKMFQGAISSCMREKDYDCGFWVYENSNLDYLKTDENGKCNDSNIILDGVTNTSCH